MLAHLPRSLVLGDITRRTAILQGEMRATFFQKVLLTILAGFCAACLLWFLRHVVNEAFYETGNEGWKKSLFNSTPAPNRR